MELKILSESHVCDGYDVECVADGTRFVFHFLTSPKETLSAVTPLAEARLTARAYDASPEGVKAAKLAEAGEAARKAQEAAGKIAEVQAAYPGERLPTVTVSAAGIGGR